MPYDLKRIPRQAEDSGAEAARIGDALREARLALGLSIEDVAAQLRIRRPHLEALEEGRVRDLPGVAYAVGFVRTYAAALGLDADEVSRRFREVAGPAAAKPKLVFPEPVPERGMPATTVILTGAAIAIGAYVAWFNWSSGGDRVVDVVPPVPPRLETAAEQGRAQLPGRDLPPRPEPGSLPLAALPPPGGLPTPTHGANTSAQAATMPAAVLPPAAPAVPTAAAPEQPASSAAAPIPGVPEGTRIVLRARANNPEGAWVQVRDPRGGRVLVNRVLRPNEVWAAPLREDLLLDTGKADGLEILVDGQPQPTLEGLVGVRRNIALDPERLRQRLVPATAAATPRN
ncbi:helix-turn-helix domain-containing protein [Roseomonas sp. AR75]|uniref:helix-turn-helix domain-containing protein n=1 Tax=Roseomonas sp. AR75 TaxID=2562311 RepID=UPI0010BF8832|nr:helix-turn-helix domain-containing protein [Roseomonas sp. AR75]